MIVSYLLVLLQFYLQLQVASGEGYPYIGTQCVGVFNDFNLTSIEASFYVDAVASQYMEQYFTNLPWLYVRCMSRLRQQTCMLSLVNMTTHVPLAADGFPYCYNQCMSADVCDEILNTAPDLSAAVYGPCIFFQQAVPPYCHSGAMPTFIEKTPVCPLPLVYPDAASHDGAASSRPTISCRNLAATSRLLHTVLRNAHPSVYNTV